MGLPASCKPGCRYKDFTMACPNCLTPGTDNAALPVVTSTFSDHQEAPVTSTCTPKVDNAQPDPLANWWAGKSKTHGRSNYSESTGGSGKKCWRQKTSLGARSPEAAL